MEASVWHRLCRETRAKPGMRKTCRLILCGHHGCGKRTLLRGLADYQPNFRREAEDSPVRRHAVVAVGYSHLEFRTLEVEEDEWRSGGSASRACSVWILEDQKHTKLLTSRLAPKDTDDMAALICLDATAPGALVEEFKRWVKVVYDIANEVGIKRESEKENAKSNRPTRGPRTDCSATQATVLGFPLICVVTKADAAPWASPADKTASQRATAAKAVECHLRRECLAAGAGLVYTTAAAGRQSGTNVGALYQYLECLLAKTGTGGEATPGSSGATAGPFFPIGADSMDAVTVAAKEAGVDLDVLSLVTEDQSSQPAEENPSDIVLQAEDANAFLRKAQLLMKAHFSAPSGRPPSTMSSRSRDDNASLTQFFHNLIEKSDGRAERKEQDAREPRAPENGRAERKQRKERR